MNELHLQLADLDPAAAYRIVRELVEEPTVDVTDIAGQAGLHHTVALSRDAWNACVAMTPAAADAGCDEQGRLGDVLHALAWAVSRARPGQPVPFEICCVGHAGRRTCIPLVAVDASEGDEFALTVVLPEELS